MEPDLRFILFDTHDHFLQENGCIACNEVSLEDNKILSISQLVPKLLRVLEMCPGFPQGFTVETNLYGGLLSSPAYWNKSSRKKFGTS